MSIAGAFWADLLGTKYGVSLWSALASFLTSSGTVVALLVLAYNIHKDRKLEAEKYDQVGEFVYAYCDETIASLAPLMGNRSAGIASILALPALGELSIAEKMQWDMYRYFRYPTNFNFRHLLAMIRTMRNEHELLLVSISRHPQAHAQPGVIAQANALVLRLIEAALVSAAVTQLLEIKQTHMQSGHNLSSNDVALIRDRTNVTELRIREICSEMRCRIVD